MTVRVNKSSFNIREKLTELERPIGLKGSELMRTETAQDARDLVSAGRKNLIINGDMAVAQRGTSIVGNTNSVFYGPDRFAFYRGGLSTTLTGTQQSVTDLPEHTTSFRVTCTGNAALGASSDGWIRYTVEDKDFARINWTNGSQKFVTLSFWAKSNRTGQFSCSLNSGDFNTAKNINTFILDQADTWKKITFTYPAPSTFTESGNIGARIYWAMGTGTTYYTSNPNIGWLYNNTKIGAVGDTQIYGDDGAYFEITGVQLEVGKNATEFEHRPIGEELALCQRYYQKIYYNTSDYPFGYCYTYNLSASACTVPLPTNMRGEASSIDLVNCNLRGSNQGGVNNGYTVTSLTYATDNGITKGLCQLNIGHNSVPATDIGAASILTNGASDATSYIAINAEL